METSTRFSKTELSLVITNCTIAKLFLVFPGMFAALSASAGIPLAIAAIAAGAVILYITSRLYGGGRRDITDMLKNKTVRNILALLLAAYFIIGQAMFIRIAAEGVKESILTDTSVLWIAFTFVISALLCARTGLKAIVRAHSFITPFTLAMLVLLVVSSFKNFDIYNLFPMLGNGIGTLSYVWLLTSYFADFLILLLIMPFASEKTSYTKIALPSFILSSAALVVVIASYTLTVPYTVSDSYFIPIYKIAQYINYESFMSRLESIFTAGWLLSFIMYSSVYLYLASMLAGRVFRSENCRPFMYVFAAVIFVLSAVPENTSVMVDLSGKYSAVRFAAGMCLPLIILIISKISEVSKK